MCEDSVGIADMGAPAAAEPAVDSDAAANDTATELQPIPAEDAGAKEGEGGLKLKQRGEVI
jgi:hypothetical protein